jgi:hypothetical protein
MERVRAELDSVLNKYAPDHSLTLTERYALIPIEGWEAEMPLLDLCLRETIRLQLVGTMYRRNISNSDVVIGTEVIPSGAFAVCSYVFSSGMVIAAYVCKGLPGRRYSSRPGSIPRPDEMGPRTVSPGSC